MRYWIAHVRAPNFQKLKKLGFLVMYPTLDDYVFLEVKDSNEKFLRKQTELEIYFLKKREKLLTASKEEVEHMVGSSIDIIEVGSDIYVVDGYYSNLDGTVIERDEDEFRVELKGYNRTYDVRLNQMSIAIKKPPDELRC